MERSTLEVKSKVPLTIEILKNLLEITGVDMPKIGFSWKQFWTAVGCTLSLIGLIGYVYIFYTSVAAKSFSPKRVAEQSDERGLQEEPALNQYVDPFAWRNAWEDNPPNYFVLLFPLVFIGFAVVLHFCISDWLQSISQKWFNGGAVILLILTLLFDGIIANSISQNIEDIKRDRIAAQETIQEAIRARTSLEGSESTESTISEDSGRQNLFLSFFGGLLKLSPIIFLGFVPAVLLTGSIYATLESWSKVRPWGEYIKQEKHKYEVELATLGATIEALENNISSLDTQINAQIKADRHPIQINADRIETEKRNLEKEIESINEVVSTIQKEMDKCQGKIDQLEDSLKLPERNRPKENGETCKSIREWLVHICCMAEN